MAVNEVQIAVRIPKGLFTDLNERAQQLDRPLAWIVRHYCDQGLRRDERRRRLVRKK